MSGLAPFNPHQGETSSLEQDDLIEIGQWYWVTETVEFDGQWTNDDGSKIKKGEKVRWLGCVMHIGSNFIELHSPPYDRSYSTERVHFKDFWDRLEFEPDAEAHIARQTRECQEQVNMLLGRVKEVTARLGVVPQQKIAQQMGESTNSLAVVASQIDANAYKNELVKAKDETLPELFKQVEKAHKNLAKWMMAPTLPTQAMIAPMKDSIGMVEDRIYTISLYAGLTEEAVKCCDGDPAGMTEKLHVMQRRLYMDEECIANYTAGGIDIEAIEDFDAWISLPENRDRLLPFPRTLAAFRVRRFDKEREDGGSLHNMFVNIELREADKWTYLYVRNGEQVWRVSCEFEFDEMIFPDATIFDPGQPLMIKMFGRRIDEMIPMSAFESFSEAYALHVKWLEEWDGKPNPEKGENFVFYSGDSPYRGKFPSGFRPGDYEPFNDDNVYYDEAMKKLADDVKRYNRVAVIIQGLFDRSLVLHPHPPVQIWSDSGFKTAVELVFDATTLTHGEKPDFEAFRTKLNASMDETSIVVGQQDYWLRVMAEKENERQANDWRSRDRHRSNYTRYHPYGNPGPCFVGTMSEWKPRAKKAVFRWFKEPSWRSAEPRPSSIAVPAGELLNVSAYQPGDYKQFFADPRTRREYLKWAPLMLAAEDYHAGKHRNVEAQTQWDY